MSEKLKVAIRLSADPKPAVRAFAELKQKSRDTWRALQQMQAELKGLAASIKALELAITRQEASIKALEVNLTRDIREMELKLTIKLGAFLVIGVTVLTLLDRLL